jgi:hypothetical protein
MSAVDPVVLAVESLKRYIQSYLTSIEYDKICNVYIEGDQRGKEVVDKVVDKSTQIGVPHIVIEFGNIRGNQFELGVETSTDLVSLSLSVIAGNPTQLSVLGNSVRRYLKTNPVFNVKDWSDSSAPTIGSAEITDVSLDDISDYNASLLSNRYVSLINGIMEISA